MQSAQREATFSSRTTNPLTVTLQIEETVVFVAGRPTGGGTKWNGRRWFLLMTHTDVCEKASQWKWLSSRKGTLIWQKIHLVRASWWPSRWRCTRCHSYIKALPPSAAVTCHHCSPSSRLPPSPLEGHILDKYKQRLQNLLLSHIQSHTGVNPEVIIHLETKDIREN